MVAVTLKWLLALRGRRKHPQVLIEFFRRLCLSSLRSLPGRNRCISSLGKFNSKSGRQRRTKNQKLVVHKQLWSSSRLFLLQPVKNREKETQYFIERSLQNPVVMWTTRTHFFESSTCIFWSSLTQGHASFPSLVPVNYIPDQNEVVIQCRISDFQQCLLSTNTEEGPVEHQCTRSVSSVYTTTPLQSYKSTAGKGAVVRQCRGSHGSVRYQRAISMSEIWSETVVCLIWLYFSVGIQ